jgi:hypothetical protein
MQNRMVVLFILAIQLIKIHKTILFQTIQLLFLEERYFLIKILSIVINQIINLILIMHLNTVVR